MTGLDGHVARPSSGGDGIVGPVQRKESSWSELRRAGRAVLSGSGAESRERRRPPRGVPRRDDGGRFKEGGLGTVHGGVAEELEKREGEAMIEGLGLE